MDGKLPIDEALKIAHMDESELHEFAPAQNVMPRPALDGLYYDSILMGVKRNIVVNIELPTNSSPEEYARKLLLAKSVRISITI